MHGQQLVGGAAAGPDGQDAHLGGDTAPGAGVRHADRGAEPRLDQCAQRPLPRLPQYRLQSRRGGSRYQESVENYGHRHCIGEGLLCQ